MVKGSFQRVVVLGAIGGLLDGSDHDRLHVIRVQGGGFHTVRAICRGKQGRLPSFSRGFQATVFRDPSERSIRGDVLPWPRVNIHVGGYVIRAGSTIL